MKISNKMSISEYRDLIKKKPQGWKCKISESTMYYTETIHGNRYV